jgi:hypothetical protein
MNKIKSHAKPQSRRRQGYVGQGRKGKAEKGNPAKSRVASEQFVQNRNGKSKGSLWNQMKDLVIQSDSMPADISSNKAYAAVAPIAKPRFAKP